MRKISMNQLNSNLRQTIKNDLKKLPESNHLIFKRMYSPGNLDAKIEDVVDRMPVENLDWAMMQVKNSLNKLASA